MKINFKIKLLVTLFFSNAYFANAQVADFTLTVKMTKPLVEYKAYLCYIKASESKVGIDSAALEDGGFKIKGKTLNPQRALLYVERGNNGFVPNQTKAPIVVYLEKGNILVSGKENLKSAKLSGTPLNADYQGYLDVLSPFKIRQDSLSKLFGKAYQQKGSADLTRLTANFSLLDKERLAAEEAYFYNHLNSHVSLDWLKQNINIAQYKSKAVSMFNKMGAGVKNSVSGMEYSKLLQSTASVEVGEKAPDFTVKNIKGEDVALSSYRGKFVLLDFWASWCAPCRRENPNVLKAYNNFKVKNFNVLSFSMDESKRSWEIAVEKDALPWEQVSDLKAWNGDVSRLYGIAGIPSNFLIDPQGKIIAKDLRGKALEDELNKLMGK